MNYEKFTIKTQEALQEASSIAIKTDNSENSNFLIDWNSFFRFTKKN